MPSITYFVRFTRREPKNGNPYEEQEYIDIGDAFAAFRLFAEPASRWIYSRIELTEYNWEESTDSPIAILELHD